MKRGEAKKPEVQTPRGVEYLASIGGEVVINGERIPLDSRVNALKLYRALRDYLLATRDGSGKEANR